MRNLPARHRRRSRAGRWWRPASVAARGPWSKARQRPIIPPRRRPTSGEPRSGAARAGCSVRDTRAPGALPRAQAPTRPSSRRPAGAGLPPPDGRRRRAPRKTGTLPDERQNPPPAWYDRSNTLRSSYRTPRRLPRRHRSAAMAFIPQFLRQHQPRPVQTRANRANGAAQHRRGIGVIHFLQIAQHHHLAVTAWQAAHGPAQRFDALAVRKVRQQIGGIHRFGKPRFFGASVHGHVGTPPLVLPQQKLARNAEQVRDQGSPARVIAALVAQQSQEYLLSDILGDTGRAAHLERKPVEGRLPLLVESHECLLPASAESLE